MSVQLINILRGAFGMFFLMFVCWLLSTNRRAINWRLVIIALIAMICFYLGVTRVGFINGFFDFLSYQVNTQGNPPAKTSFLILNSLAFFNKSKAAMDKYEQVNLYLDRNEAGIECTNRALEWDKAKYIDRSHLYRVGQDLNEWLIEKKSPTHIKVLVKNERPKHKRGRGLGL